MTNYAVPSITLVKGKGSIVFDADGKEYIDMLGGIATNILGHSHPTVVAAVSKQIKTLSHVSNFYSHPKAIELAQILIGLTGDKESRVFFAQSGAEVNEAAIKLSRKTGRTRIVATTGSFHGRTMGSLSLTGQSSKRTPFLPLLKKVKHVPFGDIKKAKRAINSRTAMVIVEPIMGEAGVIVPPSDYLKELREACTAHGALLVIDAVQTGMGRTGQWFGHEYSGIQPDVITVAKGLGAGLPLAALIAVGKSSQLFEPGDHGSTFGGNPVTTAASVAAIKWIEKNKILAKCKADYKYIYSSLNAVPGVREVRGAGLLIGISLDKENSSLVAQKLQEKGVLVNAANPNTIRIAPALTIPRKELSIFVKAFKEVMSDVY
ncbi:acetylornithine/succinylornithine aminotransferase [freshwater metagenome]|uniref:Acetylornithine/succinylornithine aminotransferase n=1 Tax=freshwater metagenome TaxID=449393 RepID=A0A094SHX2_9ZZZZ